MLARISRGHAWINILFRVGINSFAMVMYLVGAVTLNVGTLLTALHLTYRWLRDGVWHSYSLGDLLGPFVQSESWLLKTPLLVAMPAVGGTLTVAGLTIFFSVGLFWHKRVSKRNIYLES